MRRVHTILVAAIVGIGGLISMVLPHAAHAATQSEMINACEEHAFVTLALPHELVSTVAVAGAAPGHTMFQLTMDDGTGEILFDCLFDETAETVSTFSGS